MPTSGSNLDPTVSELQRRLSECVAARVADWHIWREKHDELEKTLNQTLSTRKDQEARIERLGLEVTSLDREVRRLQEVDTRFRQVAARTAQLESQAAGYQEEIEHLLNDLSITERDCAALRQQEHLLQGRAQELALSLEQNQQQLEAYSDPARLAAEGLHLLLRARFGLELRLSPGMGHHLAHPAALALEILYAVIRLQAGIPFSELGLSARIEQALDEQRKRGG